MILSVGFLYLSVQSEAAIKPLRRRMQALIDPERMSLHALIMSYTGTARCVIRVYGTH